MGPRAHPTGAQMSMLRILAGSIVIASLAACQRQQPAGDEHMAHMSPGDVALPAVASSNQQGDLSLPPSARTVAARLAASPRHGEWVTVAYEPGSKDSLIAW